MTNKLLRSFIVAMFLMFGALTTVQAEMKCAPGKCGGQMQEQPKGMKADANMGKSCPTNTKCDMKAKGKCNCNMKDCKCKDGKCDMKNCKCQDGKCDPKMKQKCAVDGKCPMNTPAKK